MSTSGIYPYQTIVLQSDAWGFFEPGNEQIMPGSSTLYFEGVGFPMVGWTPDPRATQSFMANQNRHFGTDDIYYKVTFSDDYSETEPTKNITVTFYNGSDNSEIVSYNLYAKLLLFHRGFHDVSTQRLNFYVQTKDGTIQSIGIAEEYSGLINPNNVDIEYKNGIIFTEITNAVVKGALQENIEIRITDENLGEYETYLEGTDNFLLSSFPLDWHNKLIYEDDPDHKYNNIVCRIDPDNQSIYDVSASWTNQGNITQYWKDDRSNYRLMADLNEYLHDKGYAFGSDLLRMRDGQYYNGVDLSQENIAWLNPFPDRDIDFEGGKIRFTRTGTDLYVTLLNSNGTTTDSCHLQWGVGSPPGTTNIYQSHVVALYLAKDPRAGYGYSLFGLKQFAQYYDNDGTLITYQWQGRTFNYACCFQKLHEFSNEGNAVLSNATKEELIEANPEYIPETNETASFPSDMDDAYDRTSTFPDGTNDGVRYSGDPNINATDLESTKASDIAGTGQIIEDPSNVNHIPTPLNTGMLSVLAPTESEMALFSGDLASESFLDKIVNYFSNPTDIVISAHTCIAPALASGGAKYLNYGLWKSAYTMKELSQMYYSVDMGSLNLMETSKSFADYPPTSKYSIYLPYIGMREIDGKILVGKTLKLKYQINVLTGEILAELYYLNTRTGNRCPVGLWSGNTLSRFPLKSIDYSSIINSAIGMIASTASTIAMASHGNVPGVIGGITGMIGNVKNASAPHISVDTSVSGSLTYSMYPTAYIIQQAPHFYNKMPKDFFRLNGAPSLSGGNVGEFIKNQSQYISFRYLDADSIRNLDNDGATEDEKNMIVALLKEGVYTR